MSRTYFIPLLICRKCWGYSSTWKYICCMDSPSGKPERHSYTNSSSSSRSRVRTHGSKQVKAAVVCVKPAAWITPLDRPGVGLPVYGRGRGGGHREHWGSSSSLGAVISDSGQREPLRYQCTFLIGWWLMLLILSCTRCSIPMLPIKWTEIDVLGKENLSPLDDDVTLLPILPLPLLYLIYLL